jgi:high-affinity nickel-transport protein
MTTTVVMPSLVLMLLVGMRHGLDPDHLAAIDGLTLGCNTTRPRCAPWMGGMFALGHGLMVMFIVALAALASHRFAPPTAVFHALAWGPPLLLLALAAINIRALLSGGGYPLTSLRGRLVPAWLAARPGPFSGLLLGLMFAAVFDTALQAAAWGYAAGALGGIAQALTVALIFTAGMALTDTFDGWVTARVMQRGTAALTAAFRRRLGWPIVCMCAGSGSYLVFTKLDPDFAISDLWLSLLGALMLFTMASVYGWTLYGLRQRRHVTS